MKKLLFLLSTLIMSLSFAQTGGFNYKALITQNGNALVNHSVSLRFTILENGNTSLYQEVQTANTDANGIVSVVIGTGAVQSGDFDAIDWSKDLFLKVEIDTGGGYQDFGTSELQYVPAAKYAEKAGDAWSKQGNAGTDPSVDFIGTTDNANLIFRTNNIGHLVLTTRGQLMPANTGFSTFIGQTAGESEDLQNRHNVFIGFTAGQYTTSGNSNVAVGNFALRQNTTGFDNTALGREAVYHNTTGAYNTGVGYQSLLQNTTANSNTAVGVFAMKENTTGHHNTAMGVRALELNQTGSTNTAMGYQALGSNISGNSSVAIGVRALYHSDISHLVAIGDSALYHNGMGAGSGEGLFNTAVGSKALYMNTKGTGNTALGYHALNKHITGDYNTAVGQYALAADSIGIGNTALGSSALSSEKEGNYNVALGSSLPLNVDGSDNVVIGYGAGFWNLHGSGNIFIGKFAGSTELGSNKLYIENSASATPLIGGDFAADTVVVNGSLRVTDRLRGTDSGNADMKAYIYGGVADNGTTNPGSSGGFTVSKEGTGHYKITFDHPFNSYTDYIVVATLLWGDTGFISANRYSHYFYIDTKDTAGNAHDFNFSFVVYRK